MNTKRPKSIIIGRHRGRYASHCPPRYSPTHRLAGRRHALRPALRLREPLRAGAARRAHLHHADHLFQGPLEGTLQITCHFLTTLTRTYFSPCPSTHHRICLPRTRKRHAHARAPARHTLRALCDCVSYGLRAPVCNTHPMYTAAWRDTASWRENLRPEYASSAPSK